MAGAAAVDDIELSGVSVILHFGGILPPSVYGVFLATAIAAESLHSNVLFGLPSVLFMLPLFSIGSK